MSSLNRDALGELVRSTWVEWAREQPEPKPSWLVPWADLDDGDREADRRLGEAVAVAVRDRIAAHVTELQSAARDLTMLWAGDPVIVAGFQAQDEVLASLLVLIRDES